MAIDGSFVIEVELKRLLDRNPTLKSVPKFRNLLQKGGEITEDEVVNALAELVLHPSYTLTLLSCFRAIANRILDRTVELLLVALNSRKDVENEELYVEDRWLREDETNVFDVYDVRQGKFLRLHELACFAFARALMLIPLTLGSTLKYLNVASAPFERIRRCESVPKALATGPKQLLNVVRASYIFITLRPEFFTTKWDWSCFSRIINLSMDLTLVNTEMRDIVLDMRWCSVKIWSEVLALSSKVSADLNLDPDNASQSFLRWKDFCMDVSLEMGGWYIDSCSEETEAVDKNAMPEKGPSLKRSRLSLSTGHEIMSSYQIDQPKTWNSGNPFVMTSAIAKSFEMVSLAMIQRCPVLLYGPAGAGKTALIHMLSLNHGSRVLSIHMDDQIDGKTLIGSYVSTEQPGEFRWQPGSLTQAVLNGFWVVFEDVDKAPADVLSILSPLLDGAPTFLTGHGEAIRVNESFRLFSTMTSSNSDISRFTGGRNSLGSLGTIWRKVMIGPPSKVDLLNIMLSWYPELEYLADKLIETFETVNFFTRFQLGLTTPSGYSDIFTLRDLLKLCKRVSRLGFSLDPGLSSYACSSIYKEAIDVFASFSTSSLNRLAIMREIAKTWSIPAADTLYPVNKPVIQESLSGFKVGRVSLQRAEMEFNSDQKPKPFVQLRSSAHALERIASSVKYNEPVLLVGETGTGKTTLVQTIATRLGQKLTVLNLSQQSDVVDLLGGFKPLDARFVCIPLYQEFENLFSSTFSSKDNGQYLVHLKKYLCDKNWKMLLSGFQKGVMKIVEIGKLSPGKKRKRPLSEQLLKSWGKFSVKLEKALAQVSASNGMVFSFVEGAFVKALRSGEWILLDEVNLAPPEILQRVIGVLEDEKGSVCLSERGDIDYVTRHPNFRLFACMNPATDAGKRDLQSSLRSRFTEYFVDDVLDDEDLVLFIKQFTDHVPSIGKLISKILQFYKAAKESEETLQDGANQKPHYSLRSLYRALEYLKLSKRRVGFERDLYDGFCMFFQNLLDDPSAKVMRNLICKHLLEGKMPPQYLVQEADNMSGNSYVLTKSVKKHLDNLERAVSVGRYPVLLQGPTSSGKTSLVRHLAGNTGREFVRINNHEHTDLQEYLGSYITDATGKLVFQEGPLVKAVRNGHWIVLDELNLAPSDVLEALNRLLDDNRELFVPELCETIRAHPKFMLFATQNPPVVYGGRKVLSRAFRNRFVEIHVEEIPQEELNTILEKKCEIPASYAEKMVDVMKELQLHRQSSKIFAGKHGFITPRDLFRWADRFRKIEENKSYEDLARDGYYLIAERLRDDAEKRIVKNVLESKLRVNLLEGDMYKQGPEKRFVDEEKMGKIIWTESMKRMYFLVNRCYEMREPVLLVGETGGGKTTICQMLSIMLGSKLHVLNCHQHTETSDFIGGFYPVRDRLKITKDFQNLCYLVNDSKAFTHFPGDKNIILDITQASSTIHVLSVIIKSYREQLISHPEVTVDEIEYMEKLYLDMCQLQQKWHTIFMWQDGPLIEAMKNGDLLLVDEISLADDSVLERLNSVLEPEKKLSLAEKGGSDLETVGAHANFFLLATMNPGGDYGKKELSPALRNRFTEIWVPSVNNIDDLRSIAHGRISNPGLVDVANVMLDFWEWFNHLETGRLLTVRDLLSWISFINAMERSLSAESALVHGAFLVLLDGLSLGTSISKIDAAELRVKCLSFLLVKLKEGKQSFDSSSICGLETYSWEDLGSSSGHGKADDMECDNVFGIHPFYIDKGADLISADGFEFRAPTTRRNASRVLRAMQLNKPVLLEGSPGVGKTSLVENIGKYSGHAVVRINLSEQTDIMDLLGSDLPVESDEGIQFAWSDGILLQALKKGSWVLLDELNLAPQSVLEGLNAILDHRAEVFIPELGRSFKCPISFRVFACQNPSHQGGGRKGLPKSFLNRFTKVYVDELGDEDYLSICISMFPSIERSLLIKLISFNKRLHQETMIYHKFGQDGSPWEFNLRDVYRSCEIIQGSNGNSKPNGFLNTIYIQRMRTAADRAQVMELYGQVFEEKPFINPYPGLELTPESLVIGDISIERYSCRSSGKSSNNLKILPGMHLCLEAAAQCIKNQWLCIFVGPSSSGKTSMIRSFAELCGKVLHELNLSSTTDISELLGSFEQYNPSHHYHIAVSQVGKYIKEYCDLVLASFPKFSSKRENLSTQWIAFRSNSNDDDPSTASATTDNDSTRIRDSIPNLVHIIECLKMENHERTVPVSWSDADLDAVVNKVKKLEENLQSKQHSVKFEWVTGLLVKAIENGEWVVLENANLCNPTVLDRLNSLVEQSGSITINECGTIDGKPMVLHPHPQFRMFLTVNPSFGEVSRAMRNRGVEIYMMQPYWLLEGVKRKNLHEFELREVKRFITLSGIPVACLVDAMSKAHIRALQEGSHLDVTITHLELSRWVQLFQQLVTDGNHPAWSIQISFEHTYISSFGEEKGRGIVSQVATSYLSKSELYKFSSAKDRLLCLPGGWPAPLNLREYVCFSRESCVRKKFMYLESTVSLIASAENGGGKRQTLTVGSKDIHVMDALSLQKVMFPTTTLQVIGEQNTEEIDLAHKRLSFAADWVIQQASQSDYRLYIRSLECFSSRLHPSVSSLNWFADLLKMCLSDKMEVTDVNTSAGLLNSCRALLPNSTPIVGYLRRNIEQWSKETRFNYTPKAKPLKPILSSLRRIEEKVIDLLREPLSFDNLLRIYVDLLEHHILFFKSIESHHKQNNPLQVRRIHSILGAEAKFFWLFLRKDITKLKEICPAEVEMFKTVMKDLDKVSSFCFIPIKSLLWKHGGHPTVPSSAGSHEKQCQLLNLCEMLWPRGNKFWKTDDNKSVDAALSSNVKLRYLAMQGICLSPYVSGESHDNNQNSIHQLEDMYQMLVRRADFEKHKLEEAQLACFSEPNVSCCVFTPNILSRDPGFEFWLTTQPINDETSLSLDLELLQHLTEIVVTDIEEQHDALRNLSSPLQSCIKFSLYYSSRPPTDFLPHQKLLWTVDAWSSVSRANKKISSLTMEMWFRWHRTLWDACPMLVETPQGDDTFGTLFPTKFFHPIKLAVVDQILKSSSSIKDYPLHSLKYRAASRNIWHSSREMTNSHDKLLSVARSLFQQIVLAHKKSFQDFDYTEIRSAFTSLRESTNPREFVEVLTARLALSNHPIFKSLIDSYIKPLLADLYSCSSYDIWQRIGSAFLRIGCLRYNLLICCDGLDPSEKYSIMYAALTERINSLKIELQVHEECAYLVGCTHLKEAGENETIMLEKLLAEKRRLQNKMVFRSNPGKAKDLKHICDEFLELVTAFGEWVKNVKSMFETEKMHNWQKTMSRFIDRLSTEYSEYMDIIEPVLIAIYEIKLGLSLIESSMLYTNNLGDEHFNMDSILETIHKLVRFPRDCGSKFLSFNFGAQPILSTCDIDLPTSIEYLDMNLLQKITGLKEDKTSDAKASSLSAKIPIYNNLLARIRDSAADACFIGGSTFQCLHGIFRDVANLWMKHRVKKVEESMYKFRTRTFNIESVIHIDDTSDRDSLLANGSSEMELEEKSVDEVVEADEALELAWKLQESNLDDIIKIHNQLFGSVDLVQLPGRIQVSDKDRLASFLGSYVLGVQLIKDMKGPFVSIFDAKIAPEHLLRLSLEHDHKFIHSHKLTGAYNFYKDPNPPTMAKLVEPVMSLKERIRSYLSEWNDRPAVQDALQDVIDFIDRILALPLDSPLAKALSRLESLLDRVRNLQETVAGFPLSDQLKPIFSLVSSWHKLEFETWPALLDEVQSQFEGNAGKLWFPLYSIFQRSNTTDVEEYNKSTIESLNEFFKTSNIGEFRKQLQLLLSFHGHITNDLCRRSDTSPCEWDNLKIIYNTYGFYVQLLPQIMEHIGANRRGIEKKLEELLKLCRWDRCDNQFAIEEFRKKRIKLKKIIKQYTDLLQQPLVEVLGHEALRSGKNQPNIMAVSFEVTKTTLKIISTQAQYGDDSFKWLDDLYKSPEIGDAIVGARDFSTQSSSLLYLYERQTLWLTIEDLCSTLVHCSGFWEDKRKKSVKQRVFSDLLELLKNWGLSTRNRSIEGRFGKSESWLLQPSYKVQDLLPTQADHSSGNVNVGLSNINSSSPEVTWITANEYYFKSIAAVEYLDKVSLSFHKDFSLDQVEMSSSYVDQLIEIQQEQRAFAYRFAEQLEHLKQCMWPLSNLCSSEDKEEEPLSTDHCSQHAIFKCMWQQKQIFDALCTMLYEESLFLEIVESNHVNTCESVKEGAEKILVFIQKYLLDFKNAKILLDNHLLGSNENITVVRVALHPYGVTKKMAQLVNNNFDLLRRFERDLLGQDSSEGGVAHILLGHFDDLLATAKIAESSINYSKAVDGNSDKSKQHVDRLETFDVALEETYQHISTTFERVGSLKNDCGVSPNNKKDSEVIKNWKILFERDQENLQLNLICESVMRTVQSAGELLNHCGLDSSSGTNSSVFSKLRLICALLEKVLVLGDSFLRDFLVTHRMVSILTYVLANIFTSLFTKGYGTIEEEDDENSKETTQDANGTGMGEGAGLKDVSDEIMSEEQLIGTDEANKEQDDKSEQPSKTEKGIEMDDDFDADAEDLSSDEDRTDENDENEVEQDEQLDSNMGEVGENGEVADEKLPDNDKDNDENNGLEKYEQGPSVKDNSSKDEELRAKEEDSATGNEDDKDGDAKESAENNNSNESGDEDDSVSAEDMHVDKEDASADFSGISPDEQGPVPDENTDPDENGTDEKMDDAETEDKNNDGETEDVHNDGDEDGENIMENEETGNGEEIVPENDGETDVRVPNDDVSRSAPDLNNPTSQSEQPNELSDANDLGISEQENNFGFSDFQNEFTPSNNFPDNAPELGVKVSDANSSQISGNGQSKASYESLTRKPELNPCRSLGNALEGWKERVNVTADVESQENLPEDLMDEDASEYAYTAELKDGAPQALGPATAEQTKEGVTGNDNEKNILNTERKEAVSETKFEKQTSDNVPVRYPALNTVHDASKQADPEKQPEESMVIDGINDQELIRPSETLVSFNRSEGVHEPSKLASTDDEQVKINSLDLSTETRNDAAALWRSYELSTMRLSQELAEQLRLVLEPTLASKLQGDYKTGKRINMKKVIQYIVSQFRKDKIWMRRTRPNKRDYQVVIAVDDSLSMSEGQCSNFAIEALVTVCRAMSQLEVGNFGVVSFGKQGNIRLLHDFDQHITPEAGIEMISNLTFKQENTILDEPMLELLKYLDNMLDTSVARARLPSGDNPLQQLVLIIADGHFSEKKILKQRVRNLLNKNCMVAFMILDSGKESIVEFKEVTLEGNDFKFSKYLDSFPFPYYAVLRNIEALPRTLGDLLRQWFELMQNSK